MNVGCSTVLPQTSTEISRVVPLPTSSPKDDTTRKTTELPQLTGLVQPAESDLCTELPSVQEPVSIKGTARASRSFRFTGGREATSLHQ